MREPLCTPDLFLGLLQSLLKNLSSISTVFLTSKFLNPSDFLPCLFISTPHRLPHLLNPLCVVHSSVATSRPFPVETSSTFCLLPRLLPGVGSLTRGHRNQQSILQGIWPGSCKYTKCLFLPHWNLLQCFSSQECYVVALPSISRRSSSREITSYSSHQHGSIFVADMSLGNVGEKDVCCHR